MKTFDEIFTLKKIEKVTNKPEYKPSGKTLLAPIEYERGFFGTVFRGLEKDILNAKKVLEKGLHFVKLEETDSEGIFQICVQCNAEKEIREIIKTIPALKMVTFYAEWNTNCVVYYSHSGYPYITKWLNVFPMTLYIPDTQIEPWIYRRRADEKSFSERVDFGGDFGYTRYVFLEVKDWTDINYVTEIDGSLYKIFPRVQEDATVDMETTKIKSMPFVAKQKADNVGISINANVFDGVISPNKDFKIVKGVLKKYLGNSEIVVIPECIKTIGKAAFSKSSVVSVFIPDSIEEVLEKAFYKCKELRYVVFQGRTKKIERECFNNCQALKEVRLPSGLTYIGNSAFEKCVSLTSINIPDTVSFIGWSVFEQCEKLKYNRFEENLYLGNDNNPYFYLNEVKSNKIHHETKIIGSFQAYPKNQPIVLPQGLISISPAAFIGDTWVENIIIPDSVTSINSLTFSGCTSLTNIVIPDSVKSIGEQAFSGCTSLTNIVIPNSVKSIGEQAFSGCTSLTNIVIPDSVTRIGSYVFKGCACLTNITLPNSITCIDNFVFSAIRGLTSIGAFAFDLCTGLRSITIPNSVVNIGSYAFSSCMGLTSVTIPNSVTSIDHSAFSLCTNLTSITVNEGNPRYHSAGNCLIETESKTLVAGCKNSAIPLDGSVISIGEAAFYNCRGLTFITIPDSVTGIGNSVFRSCTSLTSIVIPDSVTSIGEQVFYGCSNLKSITFNGTIKQWNLISKDSDLDYNAINCTIYCTDGIISK